MITVLIINLILVLAAAVLTYVGDRRVKQAMRRTEKTLNRYGY